MTITVPASVTWFSLAGCALAWLAYGLAFELLCVALLGPSRAPWTSYFAAFTLSYLVGYLVLFAPGGIGARESVEGGMEKLSGLVSRGEMPDFVRRFSCLLFSTRH